MTGSIVLSANSAKGLGAVYLATLLGTTRTVAVEVIIPEYAAQEEFIVRFQREAAAAGRLRHPICGQRHRFRGHRLGGNQAR